MPVPLDATEVTRYYEGFSNSTLWPLLHYFLDTARFEDDGAFETYQAVNARFADIAAQHYRPGDVLWVHDYHLMLVPEMIRARIPRARIGFFLHTPFPSWEVLRMLPWRARLLHGLLGADLVGFQTGAYRQHFLDAIVRLLDLEPEGDTVAYDGRRVRLGVYPVGIDPAAFADLARRPDVHEEAARIRAQAPGGRIVLGVDRLDYTKGIALRLAAIDRVLDRAPELRKVRFVQIAVPTREGAGGYEQMRKEVHEMVGRVNGRHGTVDSVPVHFLYQSVPVERLAALYAAADVMLVTPLRDGMNLVAKEYVASRIDSLGALVLSELAGAAEDLVEALLVNPYDTGGMASAIERALEMPEAEQRARMEALRRRVATHDVHAWARSFLGDLERCATPAAPTASAGGADLRDRALCLRKAPSLVLLLDYDGTLVPLAPLPELAAPDAELRAQLGDLAARPGTLVHIASGRRWEDLEAWFGGLPIHLHAEHGVCHRPPGGSWSTLALRPEAWKPAVRTILDEIARRTPGCLVEEKTQSLAWHYRTVETELGRERVRELTTRVAGVAVEHDLEVVRGLKVIEVRARGPGKGLAAARALAEAPAGAAIVAIGDDATDEDLFAALPPSALTIHVGHGVSRAALRVPDPGTVRGFLRALAAR